MGKYLFNGPITTEIIAERIQILESRKNAGGNSVFIGQVRADIIDGKEVTAIEYSAYEPMVSTEAGKIIEEITQKYHDVRSAEIMHSEGVVKAGEISLFVLVSAGHREQAINACHEIVELLKQRLPVWKKELFSDESFRWKGNSDISD